VGFQEVLRSESSGGAHAILESEHEASRFPKTFGRWNEGRFRNECLLDAVRAPRPRLGNRTARPCRRGMGLRRLGGSRERRDFVERENPCDRQRKLSAGPCRPIVNGHKALRLSALRAYGSPAHSRWRWPFSDIGRHRGETWSSSCFFSCRCCKSGRHALSRSGVSRPCRGRSNSHSQLDPTKAAIARHSSCCCVSQVSQCA
jgi:hypothetical protein